MALRYESRFFSGKWSLINISIGEFIRSQLKKVYNPKGKWGITGGGKQAGVINTGYDLSQYATISEEVRKKYLEGVLNNKDPHRSILNYTNSNAVCLSVIVNWMNDQISKGRISDVKELDFYNDWDNSVEKFRYIFDKYSEFILTPGSKIFNDIISVLLYTSYSGHLPEIETINRIKSFNGVTDVKQSEQGGYSDILRGVDITFKYKGKTWTIQSKKYISIEIKDNFYYIETINARQYGVDIYSFYNKELGFYMFSNKEIGIINGKTYKIPKRMVFKNISS